MSGPIDRIARYVEDLIHDRRPCRFKASSEDVAALRAAAELAAARPGADLPDREFTDQVCAYINVTVRGLPAERRPLTLNVRERMFP
jgi:cytochrome P450